MRDLGELVAKERVRSEYTVYTTKPLPTAFMEMHPVIIPCYRVWSESEDGAGALEIEAVIGIRKYRI